MKRHELEHVIRAAGSIAQADHVWIFGSQAILGQHPEAGEWGTSASLPFRQAKETLSRSMEADICVPGSPEKTQLVDALLGELSLFHDTFGYYAQGVDDSTCVLPKGWEERLIPLASEHTRFVTGWCLELHDLLISKLVAGREKDFEFFRAVLSLGWANEAVLQARLDATECTPEQRRRIGKKIEEGFR